MTMTINPNGDRRPRRDETRIMRLPDSLRAEFADAHRRQVAARDAELTAESPETARDRLSEEYGQNENDSDRNPTHDGFVAWLAEQVERLREEVAERDRARLVHPFVD